MQRKIILRLSNIVWFDINIQFIFDFNTMGNEIFCDIHRD
jgi:hypothetical protein